MSAFYFGDPTRRLFGFYHVASPVEGPARAVVLCNSWGPDYIYSHRTVRQAAIQLAAAGLHVLRFDYFGTGDSAGELIEASMAMWQDDIRTAMHEVAEMSGARQVSLIGLRLGATLAARAAAGDPALVDRLLLWDPVVRGAAYLDELFHNCRVDPQAYRGLRTRPAGAGGGHELHGFPLTDAMARDIRDLDLSNLDRALAPKCGVLISSPAEDEMLARQCLVPPLSPKSIERIAAMPCWNDQWPPSLRALPVVVLNRLVELAV